MIDTLDVRSEKRGRVVLLLLAIGIFFMGSSVYAGDMPYTRIISLYSAHTENLVSLGAEDQLIGISTSDTYPEEILSKPRFSYREDAEKFIAARPDLVLVRPMIERSYPQLLGKLRQAGITVISLQPTSIEGIFKYWYELGRLTGHEDNAVTMVTEFQMGIGHVGKRLMKIPREDRPKVYFESIHKKMKTFAPESIAIFALEQAGGINIAADANQMRKTNIAAYGKEKILAKASDIDVFIAQQGRMNPVTRKMIDEEPGFMAIKAVREGRVFIIDEAIVSRPTLRIVDGVVQLHEFLF
jgi:iron complex transport system substrate-binding protein